MRERIVIWDRRSTRRLEGVKGKPEERKRRIDEEGGWKERDLETWMRRRGQWELAEVSRLLSRPRE